MSFGGNSLLGQHIFSRLIELAIGNISVWTLNGNFVNRIEVNQNIPPNNIHYFIGLNTLQDAISNCDTVFNLHEFKDFSNCPDKKLLQYHNVDFVKKLLFDCAEIGVTNLIHISSIFLQCFTWWPNVGSRKKDPTTFMSGNPCSAYFNSKLEAEKLISNCDYLKSIVVRIGLLYGEGDRCSVICDAIKLYQKVGPLPIIGNFSGAVQFTYAGNATCAIVKCAEKIASCPNLQQEVINISDNTQIQSFFDGIARDCFEIANCSFSSYQIPFWLFFPLYFLISILGYLMHFIPLFKNPLENVLSTSYLYFLFQQSTFISDYKLRLFTNFVPPFNEDEALHRSLAYYGKKLHSIDIESYSWRAMGEL